MPITYGIIVLAILAIIVEILSVALKVTGLDLEKARFQVVSMITHTGFTTRESELITQHPTRRKIAQVLMLVSYVTTATLISVIVSAFRNSQSFLYFSLYIALGLILVLFLIRNKHILLRLEGIIERQLEKQLKINKRYKTVEEVLKLNEEYGVAEFIVEEGSILLDVTLEKSGLKQNYIQVLNIDRGSHIIHFPKYNFTFRQGDRVVVYGQIDKIKEFVLGQKNS